MPIVDAVLPPQLDRPPARVVEWHVTRIDALTWWHLVVRAQLAQQAIEQGAVILRCDKDELVATRGDG